MGTGGEWRAATSASCLWDTGMPSAKNDEKDLFSAGTGTGMLQHPCWESLLYKVEVIFDVFSLMTPFLNSDYIKDFLKESNFLKRNSQDLDSS